tara:strand:- start:1348 stop:1716 length:369 start_codon:yes stop_codon:yes gene_type:complete
MTNLIQDADGFIGGYRLADEPERLVRSDPPLAPMATPLIVTNHGYAWFPHPFVPGAMKETPICHGIGICWANTSELGGAVIHLVGGNDAAPTDEGLAIFISREGIRGLIRDLQSIDAQMAAG